MKFKMTHQRAMTGNNIHVEIAGGKDEEVKHVKVELDGFALEDEDKDPIIEEYENDFLNAGDAGPLTEHTLVVTATTGDDVEHSSSTGWTDPI
jgi:hypothetical protein